MDPLDRLTGPATDLLARVDDLLACSGAPGHHRIWPLLRRMHALPGEAVAAVAASQAAPLAAAGATLRELSRRYDDTRALLDGEVAWSGAAAEEFAVVRVALATHLSGGQESLAGRLESSAAYLEALADWVVDTRRALAATLADVLGSAEAVAVVTGGLPPGRSATSTSTVSGNPGAAEAAAEIGARVLAATADAYERVESLACAHAPALSELRYRAPVAGGGQLDATTRVAF